MSWTAVAEKDFRDAIRSRMLIALTVLFVLFAVGFTYLFSAIPRVLGNAAPDTAATIALLSALNNASALVVPLIGLVVGYKALVGERASGSLKLLLGLPHSRRDVVIGKLVGRTGVVAVAVLVGFAAAAVAAFVLYDSFAIVEFATYAVLTVLLGAVFVAIAVGFSAGLRSTSWALYGAIGLFVLFEFVWNFVPVVVLYVINGFELPQLTTTPEWASLFALLNPQRAYSYAAASVIPELSESVPTEAGDPFYLQEPFGFVVLAFWLVVPLALGYLRFDGTDL
ncbi:ABC transporter [Halobacteriales archaeon QS_4_69_34]|nr:MAG: ABC transporter [Halobacteriales archaeon QS_4_69_34]